jgi:hypothetical protein
MSNPTSNFGWQMPTPTDLVTDLPADFEVFGQAVDSDFVDLLGGTTGQVLSKTSNTDLDFTWVSPTAGDIEGVSPGIGILGGGTSGTVTVTNSMATAIDAKGDLIVGTGADTFSRLAVGANTYTLVADSAEATGLKWAAPAGGVFAGVRANNATAAQTIPNNIVTVLTFSAENFDTNTYHSTSSNTGRLTVPAGKAGYYRIYYSIQYMVNGGGRRAVDLTLNGTSTYLSTAEVTVSAASYPSCNGSTTYYLNDGDYVNLVAYQTSGGNLDTNAGAVDHFGMEKID